MQQLPFWRPEPVFLKNGKVPWMFFILSKPCINSSMVAWQGPGQLKSQVGKLRSGVLWLTQVTHSLSWDEDLCFLALKFWNMLAPRSKIMSLWWAWGTSVIKAVGKSEAGNFATCQCWGCCIKAIPSTPLVSWPFEELPSVCFGSYLILHST